MSERMPDFPTNHPEVITRSERPLNLEPPVERLRQHYVTPTGLFYIRNHGLLSEIDTDQYRLYVTGMVEQELRLSFEEIRESFSKSTVAATLQCAGNRRQGLAEGGVILNQHYLHGRARSHTRL